MSTDLYHSFSDESRKENEGTKDGYDDGGQYQTTGLNQRLKHLLAPRKCGKMEVLLAHRCRCDAECSSENRPETVERAGPHHVTYSVISDMILWSALRGSFSDEVR